MQQFGMGSPASGMPGVRSNPFAASGAQGGADCNVTAPQPTASLFGAVAPPTAPFSGPPTTGPPRAAFDGAGRSLAPPPTADQLRSNQSSPNGPSGSFRGSHADPFGAAARLQPAPSASEAIGMSRTQIAQSIVPAIGACQSSAVNKFMKESELMNSPPVFTRSTLGKLPCSVSCQQMVNVPIGFIVQPLAQSLEEVPTINSSLGNIIIRCRNCRTYANPYVQWAESGRSWSCNLCGFLQSTPDNYVGALDEKGKPVDRFHRPELSKGAVEYIAPSDYMVRPPQPPCFVFVIDVTRNAVSTGMLDTVVSTIKEAIQQGTIPGGTRTKIGIMTFDMSLHFYRLLSTPQMFVVADPEDVFKPLDDMLVNLADNADAVLSLLDSLPQMFAETQINESCMGSAIKSAHLLMQEIGGKMLVLGVSIPSVGHMALKSSRGNPKFLGTDREVELLRPANDSYKEFAAELCKVQISVELFLGPQSFVDLPSIVSIAKLTSGDVRYYPCFHIQHSGLKLKADLLHVLTRYMGWEAVMRIRVSKGWKITKYYGNVHLKGADLLVMPNCHTDQTVSIAVEVDENVSPDHAFYVQSALLYTNCDGERRIRVNTWAAPTTPSVAEILGSVDVQATSFLLAQACVDQSLSTTLADGRNQLQARCQQIVQSGNIFPNLEAPQCLPLYIMGMLKSTAFRTTNDISADARIAIWTRLASLSVEQASAYFYPRMIALHNLSAESGTVDENGAVVMPPMLNLTSESMTQDGVYLVEDGQVMFVWCGRSVDAGFVTKVFGNESFDAMNSTEATLTIGTRGDPISARIGAILEQIRRERPTPFMQLHVVRQGEPREPHFFSYLIEDRTVGLQSTYREFLQQMGYKSPQAHMSHRSHMRPQQAHSRG